MVTTASIRQGIFKAMYPLINNNKPNGWKVKDSFPESKEELPCIVLNPTRINLSGKVLNGKLKVKRASMGIYFYCKESDKPETIDIGKDNVQDTLNSNTLTLEQNQLAVRDFDDSAEVEPDEFGGQHIWIGEITVVFGVML